MVATNTVISEKEIINQFESILGSLSDKEQVVLKKRIGLDGQKQTLQHIGNTFSPSITRERVRQIEDAGIKKVGRVIKGSQLEIIQTLAKEIISMHGGLYMRDKLVSGLIKEMDIGDDFNTQIIDIIIQSDYDILKSKPKLGTQTYFHEPSITRKQVNLVFKTALSILKKRKDVMDKDELYETIINELKPTLPNISPVFIDSVMDIHDDIVKGEENLIGLTKWKILNPKTLKDKAIYVLNKEKTPLHFIEISNKISEHLGETVKINTIHNELIRNEEFVLIGRGIYALKAWGFKAGTVLDVIVDILKKENGPLSTDEITKRVLKVRDVKNTTIYMNLQNKDVIQRVGRNFYDLKK